ncbi:hypothetical protein BGZ81_003411 [Podila clonocystis]|nr:hypothetical protein BGZ81_003411 [Podila clonocystis]
MKSIKSSPLHTVFEKRLSKKKPVMPASTFQPSSILVKDMDTSMSENCPSSSQYGRRGSNCSGSSSSSSTSLHDCYSCTLLEEAAEEQIKSHSAMYQSSSSESSSISLASAQSTSSRQCRIRWADQP